MKDRTFNFARLFVQETGMKPAKFVEGARLEAARCTLEQTALPVEAIEAPRVSVIPSACAGASVGCSGSALASRREGVSGKQSWPIACVGERFVDVSQKSVGQSRNGSRGIT